MTPSIGRSRLSGPCISAGSRMGQNGVRRRAPPDEAVIRIEMRHVTRVVIVLAAFAAAAAAQAPGALEVLHVRGNIYVLFGAGGNITMSVGPDGVLLVDSGAANQAEAV